jgi:hypothetical protein
MRIDVPQGVHGDICEPFCGKEIAYQPASFFLVESGRRDLLYPGRQLENTGG